MEKKAPRIGTMEFSAEGKKEFERIIGRYPFKQSAVLAVLHLAQEEFGWVSPEAVEYVAGMLEMPPIRVWEVASFYTMYNKKPVGKFHIQVCRNLSCSLMGAESLIETLKKKLGLRLGETTPDNLFTLSAVECLAACDGGPCLQVNDAYHLLVKDEASVDDLLNAYREKAKKEGKAS